MKMLLLELFVGGGEDVQEVGIILLGGLFDVGENVNAIVGNFEAEIGVFAVEEFHEFGVEQLKSR